MGSLTVAPDALLCLDTTTLIYSVERHEPYWGLLEPIWIAAEQRRLRLCTSVITITEYLVGPLRTDNRILRDAYLAVFRSTSLQILPVDQSVAEEAARIRTATRLPTPDAIHAATALTAGCDGFLTNDDDFRRVEGLTVTVLRDCLA